MALHNRLEKSKFDACKLLLKSGISASMCAKLSDIHVNTVYAIRDAETWAEYQANNAKRSAANRATRQKNAQKEPQIVEHKQTVTIQATWQMTQEMQKTNKLLEQISNKLAFIVDELTGVKSNAKPDH